MGLSNDTFFLLWISSNRPVRTIGSAPDSQISGAETSSEFDAYALATVFGRSTEHEDGENLARLSTRAERILPISRTRGKLLSRIVIRPSPGDQSIAVPACSPGGSRLKLPRSL